MNVRNVRAASARLAVITLLFLGACSSSSTSPDATVPDAPMLDATAECQADSDCDNGLYCDGIETCSDGGQCISGEAIACNDSIACTIDTCSNEREECVFKTVDADDDGHGDLACTDASGTPLGDDCDDSDSNRYPGNVEFCDADNHDEDCDPTTFGFIDIDLDGVVSAACCNADDAGVLLCGLDCDDTRANVKPGVSEVCDGLDNNCNGMTDEGVTISGFEDMDGDGYGRGPEIFRCAGLGQFSTVGGDCADGDPTRNPGQIEICDGIDNNCDDLIDNNTQTVLWYVDNDGDGFGSATDPNPISSCSPQSGHSTLNTDCDDTQGGINPGSQELCDGIDNDCNGLADFRIGENDFEDDDQDGLVDIACSPLGTDCDDTDPNTGPGTIELCDGRDNDCDGAVDEDVVQNLWYRDIDEDSFGSAASGSVVSCTTPLGYSLSGGDCNDHNPNRNPGVAEICNGDDDDCDGAVDETPSSESCNSAPNAIPVCIQGGCAQVCLADYQDCDGDGATGCETSLPSDPANCGSCGNACSGKNQSGTCTAGICECASGFADCDGLPGNGCEVELANNPSNCGTCGTTCTATNALSQCVLGTCEILSCGTDYADCNASTVDGCETSTNTDTNCGSCGNDCTALVNTTAACGGPSMDRCLISACTAGFMDCDPFAGTGCQTNTDTDSGNCGSCGNDCTSDANSLGSCTTGACDCKTGFLACQSGRCDIDGQTDLFNCGSCGNNCMSLVVGEQPTCNAGACEAVCPFNRSNCDGNVLTCETDTQNDNANCGSCGNACVLPLTCGNGVCGGGGGGGGAPACTAGLGGNCQVLKLTTGQNFSCALKLDGSIACWGDNAVGQLGNGGAFVTVPTLVDSTIMGPAKDVASGAGHSCAISTVGDTYCWGDNGSGQLGVTPVGISVNSPALVTVGTIPQFMNLAAGRAHTCGVDLVGNVLCWGDNSSGQLAQPLTTTFTSIPTQIMTGIPAGTAAMLVAGDDFTCALTTTQEVYCWGAGMSGQLGNGAFGNSNVPTLVLGYTLVTNIAAGGASVCGVSGAAGSEVLHCWGSNTLGQLGSGPIGVNANAPVPVTAFPAVPPAPPPAPPKAVAVGGTHACALDANGTLYCWGDNVSAQLGQGFLGIGSPSPLTVATQGGKVQQLGQGSSANHSCVIDDVGAVFCWGDNTSGQCAQDPSTALQVTTPLEVFGI